MTTAATFTNEFYVTLPNNSSTDYFPENRSWSFRTKLAKPISLHGNWEVGLAEIQYPHTWNTVEQSLKLRYTMGDKDAATGKVFWWSAEVPPGQYPNVESVLETIHNNMVPDALQQIKFFYDKATRLVSLQCVNQCEVRFNDPLLPQILGFDYNEQLAMKGQTRMHVAKRVPDLKLGHFGLWVYTDITAPVPVGDATVPLLRIVAVEGEDGDIVTKTYDRPHYVPVNQSHFDCLEVHISSDLGRFVSFEYGKVVVKLHFRPRRLQYL